MYASTYKGWGIILLWLIFSTLLIYYAIDKLFFENYNLFYRTYENQLNIDRISEMLKQAITWKWVGYLFVPVIILMRISYTSVCIYIGCFLADIKVRFIDIFKLSILADFVFVISGILKLIILIFFKNVNTLDDLQVQPLSLLNLFDKNTLDIFYRYPLSVLNIFEAIYMLVLVWIISDLIGRSFMNSFKTIATSYGTGLLLWVLLVMFINITLT